MYVAIGLPPMPLKSLRHTQKLYFLPYTLHDSHQFAQKNHGAAAYLKEAMAPPAE